MKKRGAHRMVSALLAAAALLTARAVVAQDDPLESLASSLKFSAFDGNVNARISGLLDLEGYYVQQPPPGLIDTNHNYLFNPRLTLYLDAQIGPKFYFFAQARVDRGFDPADDNMQIRLDEYALRYTPWNDGRLNVQLGKFATVVGNWTSRHDSWENPFITAPLPYENLTSIWDSTAADSFGTVLSWVGSDKYQRNPIIWGPSYTTGAAVSGRLGKLDYAAEIKNAALSSRPDTWNITNQTFTHPTFSGRIGCRPGEEWNLGFSASVGDYLMPDAASTVPPGHMFGDYREILFGQDISYAWHHWQVWAEVFETRFVIPGVGNADTLAYYVEAKYKFTPQLFAALRWNQQVYNNVQDEDWESYPWSNDVWRIDAALTYRFTPDMQAKLQYSFMRIYGGEEQQYENFVALQFTVRF
jgi:hypothetical protein